MLFLFAAAGSCVLLPLLENCLYLTELTIFMVAIGFKVISLALTSFAVESWMLYLNLPLEAVNGMGLNCLLTVVIKLSNNKDVGKILCLSMIGWITIESGSLILSSLIAAKLYPLFHGSALVIMAGVMLGLFGCILWLSVNLRTHKHHMLLQRMHMPDDSDLEVEAEQWLLDAYKISESSSDTGDDQNEQQNTLTEFENR